MVDRAWKAKKRSQNVHATVVRIHPLPAGQDGPNEAHQVPSMVLATPLSSMPTCGAYILCLESSSSPWLICSKYARGRLPERNIWMQEKTSLRDALSLAFGKQDLPEECSSLTPDEDIDNKVFEQIRFREGSGSSRYMYALTPGADLHQCFYQC